jgi:hypothetical protein
MGRIMRWFAAPGPEEEALPLPHSPWHAGRCAIIPDEEWQLILSFAHERDPEGARLLEACANPDNLSAKTKVRMRADEIRKAREVIHQLTSAIRGGGTPTARDPRTAQLTAMVPAHGKMLDALAAVLDEALRLEEPFHAWVD